MPNGSAIFARICLLVLWLSCINLCAQRIDSTTIPQEDYPSFKVEEECRSKSERMSRPGILKFTREKLAEVKTVKELIKDIPGHCDVLCVVISIKKQDDKVFEFRNIGNDMVYASRLATGKYVMVESLSTTCPTLHKANYKILIEDAGVQGK